MSNTSQVQLFFVEEDNWSVTPTTAMTEARFTGEDLNYDIGTVQSQEIRDDRQVPDLIQVSFEANGGFNLEMSFASFDPFLQGGLFDEYDTAVALDRADISAASGDNSFNTAAGSFVTAGVKAGQWLRVSGFVTAANNGFAKVVSVAAAKIVVSGLTLVTEAAPVSAVMKGQMLRNGTTEKSFTLEKSFADITQFISYTGMVVNQVNLAVSSQQVITGGVQFMGQRAAIAQTTVGTGTPIAANANPVMNSGAHVGSIRENGSEVVDAFIQSLALNVNNNLRSRPAVGVVGATSIGSGQCVVTGSLEAYFETESLYEKYVDNTTTALDFRVTDALGNTYIFTLPAVKFSGGRVVAGGNNQDVMVSMSWQAIRDAVTDCTIQIDKIVA